MHYEHGSAFMKSWFTQLCEEFFSSFFYKGAWKGDRKIFLIIRLGNLSPPEAILWLTMHKTRFRLTAGFQRRLFAKGTGVRGAYIIWWPRVMQFDHYGWLLLQLPRVIEPATEKQFSHCVPYIPRVKNISVVGRRLRGSECIQTDA